MYSDQEQAASPLDPLHPDYHLEHAKEHLCVAYGEDSETIIYWSRIVMEEQHLKIRRLEKALETAEARKYWEGFEAGWDEGWSHAF